jgi:hypothetical protein
MTTEVAGPSSSTEISGQQTEPAPASPEPTKEPVVIEDEPTWVQISTPASSDASIVDAPKDPEQQAAAPVTPGPGSLQDLVSMS